MSTTPTRGIGSAPIQGRAVLYHIFSIDVGFLVDPANGHDGIDQLVRARADGSMGERVADHGTQLGTFRGVSEEDQIVQRGERSVRAGGKSIWSETILRREAPLLKSGEPRPGPKLSLQSRAGAAAVRLDPSPVQTRIFRRGALSIMFRHTFAPPDPEFVTVEHFVDALAYAANELAAEAHTEIGEFLDAARSGRHHFAASEAAWRPRNATTAQVIRDNTVQHSIYFLEAVPGFAPVVRDDEALDLDDPEVHKSIAAVLDTNRLRDRYDRSYTHELISSATRWRDDELYVTEHRRSLVVLADYWKEGDSLVYYMEDLALAAAFELAKITHVRFLANHLARVAPRFDVRNAASPGRDEALRFVEIMQDAVSRSSYDDPTENLISHKFTSRFLAGISRERYTADSIAAMAERTDSIAQRIQLQATMAIAEKALTHQKMTVALSVFAVAIATLGLLLSQLLT